MASEIDTQMVELYKIRGMNELCTLDAYPITNSSRLVLRSTALIVEKVDKVEWSVAIVVGTG
jgi:hypothetical protein